MLAEVQLFEELDKLIVAGYGSVPQYEIPQDAWNAAMRIDLSRVEKITWDETPREHKFNQKPQTRAQKDRRNELARERRRRGKGKKWAEMSAEDYARALHERREKKIALQRELRKEAKS